MNFKQFCSDILILSDRDKARHMSAYMRDQFDFIGILANKRREVSAKHFEQGRQEEDVDWDFVTACWEQNFREFQYVAIDYLFEVHDKLKAEDIERIEALITDKSWWDTVDGLQKIVGYLVTIHPELKKTIRRWSKSENIWLRRSAIIHQLHFKATTDTDMLSEIIEENLGTNEYFINKAIGWSLREYSKTDPDWVVDFVREHRDSLSKVSVNEALRYIEDKDID